MTRISISLVELSTLEILVLVHLQQEAMVYAINAMAILPIQYLTLRSRWELILDVLLVSLSLQSLLRSSCLLSIFLMLISLSLLGLLPSMTSLRWKLISFSLVANSKILRTIILPLIQMLLILRMKQRILVSMKILRSLRLG